MEQRLIDANALREDWLENGENEYVYDTNSFLESLDDAPTIDPEALPIVRQLRAELARVTEERNLAIHAVKKLIQEDSNPCVFCSKAGILCSGMNPDFCESFEWRGPQKEE